jgi:putative NADPH-quinone reductase
MTPRHILLIQGHPDASAAHLCHALADAYAQGAAGAGHAVRRAAVATATFPLLASQADWESGELPPALQTAQDDIRWAHHIVLFFPLWLGDMPAMLKGFLEQVMRPDFAFVRKEGSAMFTEKGLTGRSARVVVTMGMPALVYRWYFRAHSVRALERNILGFVGMGPISETLIGNAAGLRAQDSSRWLSRMRALGERCH